MNRILCFGDSNTWGNISATPDRFPADVRWTGVLQRELGDDYLVIEEGYNGRTSVFTDVVEGRLSGIDYFGPCLDSQSPLDLVIIMLGTNDLVRTDAFGATEGVRALIERTWEMHKPDRVKPYPVFTDEPRILVIAPPLMHTLLEQHEGERHRRAPQESRKFARLYGQLAKELGVEFLDASIYAEPSDVDGIHMGEASHRRLGEAIAHKILQIFA